MKLFLAIILSTIIYSEAVSQNIDSLTELLMLDTQYCFLQFHNNESASNFKAKFDNSTTDRIVICHYGASHIQSEIVTRKASELLKQQFGNAGPGFLFPFSAADTYDGINYKTSHKGKWEFAKSYQLPPKIPLGIRGMTIQTADTSASVRINFKEKLPANQYDFIVLYECHDSLPGLAIHIDSAYHEISSLQLKENSNGALHISYFGAISSLEIAWKNDNTQNSKSQQLRLYGMSLEHQDKSGIVYHPMGVGASPFQAVLNLEKLTQQAKVLEPDIVIIDYGTNNILYTNEVPSNLPEMVDSAVEIFRQINPDITIVLTSTQDLYYKKKYIDAAIEFNYMMDSLAAIHKCMYWNFYDLSGGYMRITDWRAKGYAKEDHIHLTPIGYELKGLLLYQSIINTLDYIKDHQNSKQWNMPVCKYEHLQAENNFNKSRKSKSTQRLDYYVVKRGDTLSQIALKNNLSVSKMKKLNQLKNDKIKIGQRLIIR